MEKKENASKLISSLVALSLATTLGVPTIALADEEQSAGGEQPAASATTGAQQQAAEGESNATPSEANGNDTGNAQSGETDIAKMNGTEVTLSTGKYTISASVTKSINISKDATVEINIHEGATLTNTAGKHTITNNGTLTITGSGTVDNVSHERGALVNEPGATATLNGCTFTRSKEAGKDKDNANGNSWYTIKNYGTMTVGENTVVTTGSSYEDGKYSSLIANGWQNGDDLKSHPKASGQSTAIMTIEGGTFSRGLNTIKNDDYGDLTISGGSFTNYTQAALQNHSVATVSNGKFDADSDYAIYNCPCDENADKGELSISGGDFKGTIYSTKADGYGFLKVTGGTFSDPGVYQYAESGTVNVKLADDYTGDIVVPAEVTSTLNLNGHKITNISSNTIFNKGTLTVDGAGTIDNVTHGKAAIYNIGTATLKSGTFDRSKEAGTDNSNNTGNNGGNSYYTILNHGAMTVENAVTVNNKGGFSSLFSNGYYDWKNKDGVAAPTLTINGGSYSGGLNTIKNDDDAILTINGGTFKNYTQAAFQNHGTATVTNGDFSATSKYAIDNCGCDETHDPGKLTISDGHFTGILNIRSQYSDVAISGGKFDGAISKTAGSLNITGGMFLSEPDASYIADGYETVGSGPYTVQRISSIPANPAPTTETTTTTNPDGTTTTTVTDKKTGESTSTTEGANGTTVVKRTDASGNTTTEVTVPEGAATNAGAPVEIPAAAEVAKGEQVSVSAPAGTVVALPVASAGAGDVAVIVHADGTETVIPMSLVEGGKAIVKLDGDETIKIVDNAKDFSDVPAEHWVADDIDFASSHEIFKGIGNGDTYEPETALTRNMMMTVLARTDGADTSDSDPWYAKGQQWAVDNGVSNGLWGEDSITREQLVTMLFNYANKSGMDTSARADVSGMENADAVSSWATEAVQWAVAEGILKGVDNTDLAPQGLATRAQAAAFMQRYVKAALL